MAKEFLMFVILDVEAGKESEALDGLVKNLQPHVGGPFNPTAIWRIHHGCDFAVELRVKDPTAILELDGLLVDAIRSVPGIAETLVRPVFNFRFLEADGSKKAYEAARQLSDEILGVVLCDVECGKDKQVHEALLALKPDNGVTPVEVEMGFHSADFDLSALLVGTSHRQFYDYVQEHIRSLDGVHDTFLEVWEIERLFGEADAFVSEWAGMAG